MPIKAVKRDKMNKQQIKAVKNAIAYLDSFIDCESDKSDNCPDCELKHVSTDIIDFTEARKALDILNAEFDIEDLESIK